MIKRELWTNGTHNFISWLLSFLPFFSSFGGFSVISQKNHDETRHRIAQTQTIKHFQMKLTSIDLISTHVYKKEIMIWNGCFWYIKFKISNKLDLHQTSLSAHTPIMPSSAPWERESYNLLNFQGLLQTIKSCWQFYWEDYTLF